MRKGIGKVWGHTTQLGNLTLPQQRGFSLGPISWADNVDVSTKESQRPNAGALVTARTVKGASTYTVDLSWNEVDWMHMGFEKNEFPKTGADVPIPTVLSTSVPTTAPYEITNAFFTDANDALYGIFAIVVQSGAWGQTGGLIRGTTTPAAGEVVLDDANTKLVFNAAQAGAPIDIPIFATKNTIQYYGGAGTAVKYGTFELWGEIYIGELATNIWRHYPQLEIVNEPSVEVNDGVPETTMTLSASFPAGWEKPYVEYNLDTAT